MRLIVSGILLILCSLSLNANAQLSVYCQLKGPVFIDPDISRAHYRVYLEDSESFADLLIFKTANALFADKPCLWYLTPVKAQASFSIVFVKDRSKADFSIHFIDTESFAGCQNSK